MTNAGDDQRPAGAAKTAGMSSSSENAIEVVTQNGRRVKLIGRIENPWSHGEPYVNGFRCNYCNCQIKGGGVTRLREHLGGLVGNVAACVNVPLNVKTLMTDQVAVRRIRRQRNKDLRFYVEREVMEANKGLGTLSGARIPLDEAGQIEMALRESMKDFATESKRSACASTSTSCSPNQQSTLDRFYRSPSVSNAPFDIDLARSKAQVQPRVDVMLRGGHKDKLAKALAKWFHANDIPGKKADCPYFRAAFKLAQQLGEGVPLPTGKEIDGHLLDKNYEEMEAHMAESSTGAHWWDSYGGECKELQQLARRIVSQCVSSSGCERNWSTFALVHSKVRNRLGYEKLHKLVSVHYNLKLRIQHFENDMQSLRDINVPQDKEIDPYGIMMDVAMYVESNPIMDWLCNSRSESTPILDEYDENEPESPTPSRVILEELGMDGEEVAAINRKTHVGTRGGRKKQKLGEKDSPTYVESGDSSSDSPQGSPTYIESGDSSSDHDDQDNDDCYELECDGGPCSDGTIGNGSGANNDPTAPVRPRSARRKRVSVRCLYNK